MDFGEIGLGGMDWNGMDKCWTREIETGYKRQLIRI
jgi:hypothetical protein